MLNQPAPFPFPGSAALLAGQAVTIIAIKPDGRRLVSGPSLIRTVDVAELADADLSDDPLGQWFDARVIVDDGEADFATAVVNLLEDCRAFMRARRADPGQLPTAQRFGRFLTDRGLQARYRRLPGQPYARRTVAVTLKPEHEA